MPLAFDRAIAETGTRFRIFVLPPYAEADFAREPETVTVSVPPDRMQPGPADNRMYVVDAINKNAYSEWEGPPYLGPARPPVNPGSDGHFDQIPVSSRDFLPATMYATVRRTLDIWEGYFGRNIPWHFALDFPRMELIPAVNWDNAQSGYGFLEFGFGRSPFGGPDRTKPYCENFDVLSHELGHSIIFSSVGFPSSQSAATAEYGGFHESAGDLTAIVATLHFNQLVEHLLDSSKGNLFTINELSRVGEVSKSSQIRLAFNYEKLSTVSGEPHELSLPLTGALFDIFVEVFQKKLVQASLITQALADEAMGPEGGMSDTDEVNSAFAKAYENKREQFKAVLLDARDYFGFLLADIWQHLRANFLDYTDVGLAALTADQRLTAGAFADTIRSCFAWREITFSPGHLALTRFQLTDCLAATRSQAPSRSSF